MHSSSTAESAATDALSSDALDAGSVRLVADPERLHLLAALYRLDTRERLSALARTVAVAMGADAPGDADAIHKRLYHVHVPKLEAAAFLDYDDEARTVALTDDGEALAASFSEREELVPA